LLNTEREYRVAMESIAALNIPAKAKRNKLSISKSIESERNKQNGVVAHKEKGLLAKVTLSLWLKV